jgi:hypothetical protein
MAITIKTYSQQLLCNKQTSLNNTDKEKNKI